MDLSKDEARLIMTENLDNILTRAYEVALHSTHPLAGETMDDIGHIHIVAVKIWNVVKEAVTRGVKP